MIKKIVLTTLLLVSLCEAREEDPSNRLPSHPRDSIKYPSYVPPVINSTRYQRLDLDNDDVNKVRKKMKIAKDIVNGIYDLPIFQKPKSKVFKTVDTLYMHPNFIYTILLPHGYRIDEALPSFATTVFQKRENEIRIQPVKNFNSGNIVVSIVKDGKNRTMTLVIHHYFKQIVKKEKLCGTTGDKGYKTRIRNIVAEDSLPLVIEYVEDLYIGMEVSIEVLETFNKIRDKSVKYFESDGDYQKVHHNGQVFYIQRDDNYGSLYQDGFKVKVVPHI